MPAEIGFRPVTPADRPLLAAWIARPHWQCWWGEAEAEAASIAERATVDFGPFIFTLDGRDAGYIQWWRPDGAWEIPVAAPPETTRGLDMGIADAGHLGRGIGPAVLAAFMRRLEAEGVTRFLIDPAPGNIRALRAYARAGFAEFARGHEADGPYVLMVRDVAAVPA